MAKSVMRNLSRRKVMVLVWWCVLAAVVEKERYRTSGGSDLPPPPHTGTEHATAGRSQHAPIQKRVALSRQLLQGEKILRTVFHTFHFPVVRWFIH